jgi:hypothetical protein
MADNLAQTIERVFWQRSARSDRLVASQGFLGPAMRRLACDAGLYVISGRRTRGRRPSDALIEVALERSQIGATKVARGRCVA